LIGVFPEAVLGKDFLDFPQPFFLAGDVKDTPLACLVVDVALPAFV
jgi:hypothetical protein